MSLKKDVLPHVAFEYFIAQGRIFPVPHPRFRHDPTTAALHVVIPDIGPLAVEPEVAHDFDPSTVPARGEARAYILRTNAGEYRLLLAVASAGPEAERLLDEQLTDVFVREVGLRHAKLLARQWVRLGPGLLFKGTERHPADPNDPQNPHD